MIRTSERLEGPGRARSRETPFDRPSAASSRVERRRDGASAPIQVFGRQVSPPDVGRYLNLSSAARRPHTCLGFKGLFAQKENTPSFPSGCCGGFDFDARKRQQVQWFFWSRDVGNLTARRIRVEERCRTTHGEEKEPSGGWRTHV